MCFDVLLTVHLTIFILVINQPDAQNLFYNKLISCLYMFRALCAHHQEVRIVLHSIWYRHTCRQWRTQEFCSGGRGSTNSVEDRGQAERGSGGSSPLVGGSGGSCNLVQERSFNIVKFS